MLLVLFLTVVTAVFPVQLLLCFSRKKKAVKLLPLAVPLLCVAVCAVLVLLADSGARPQDDLLVAASLVMIGLYLFAAIGIAWLISGVVKLVQKRNKKIVM